MALQRTRAKKRPSPVSHNVGQQAIMRKRIILKLTLFLVFIFMIYMGAGTLGAAVQPPINDTVGDLSVFDGRWKTDSGSEYEFINGEMICISVHDKKYNGWIGKVALRNFRRKNDKWYADQAKRYHDTGNLSNWLIAEIYILDQSSFIKTVFERNEKLSKCCKPQVWKKFNKDNLPNSW